MTFTEFHSDIKLSDIEAFINSLDDSTNEISFTQLQKMLKFERRRSKTTFTNHISISITITSFMLIICICFLIFMYCKKMLCFKETKITMSPIIAVQQPPQILPA